MKKKNKKNIFKTMGRSIKNLYTNNSTSFPTWAATAAFIVIGTAVAFSSCKDNSLDPASYQSGQPSVSNNVNSVINVINVPGNNNNINVEVSYVASGGDTMMHVPETVVNKGIRYVRVPPLDDPSNDGPHDKTDSIRYVLVPPLDQDDGQQRDPAKKYDGTRGTQQLDKNKKSSRPQKSAGQVQSIDNRVESVVPTLKDTIYDTISKQCLQFTLASEGNGLGVYFKGRQEQADTLCCPGDSNYAASAANDTIQ